MVAAEREVRIGGPHLDRRWPAPSAAFSRWRRCWWWSSRVARREPGRFWKGRKPLESRCGFPGVLIATLEPDARIIRTRARIGENRGAGLACLSVLRYAQHG